MVDGYRPEALLGDRDAEDLGIITFNKEGREETQVRLMVGDLRRSGKKINTGREQGVQATKREREESPWPLWTSSKARLSLTR